LLIFSKNIPPGKTPENTARDIKKILVKNKVVFGKKFTDSLQSGNRLVLVKCFLERDAL